jgi:hypothetical protein
VLEAVSTYATATPQNPEMKIDEQHWNQRICAHAEFEGISTLSNVWILAQSTTADLVGVAFGALPSGIPPSRQKYDAWAANFPGLGSETAMTNNPDGDLLDNLAEYAFGGDPSDAADQGIAPVKSIVSDGSTNYLEYIYARYSDYADRGLTYTIQVNDNLVIGTWTNSGYTVEGVAVDGFGGGFDAVTNRVPAVDAQKFIRTHVEFSE